MPSIYNIDKYIIANCHEDGDKEKNKNSIESIIQKQL